MPWLFLLLLMHFFYVAFGPSDVADVSYSVVADAFEVVVVVVVVVAAPTGAPVATAPAVAEDSPPLPPRIEDRSSLAKLELRVEK
jgi:hypothetical protein